MIGLIQACFYTLPYCMPTKQPNVVFVFADQWRLQALGYAGDPNVRTPNLDKLAAQSIDLRQATSGWSVCSPYRASLLTGQYPLTHGVFLNDVPIGSDAVGLGTAFRDAGYHTGYIGKWHVDGRGRSAPIPPARRLGFEHWQVLECTHDYNRSHYYEGDDATKRMWPEYDAISQTRAAQRYLENTDSDKPFFLVLSWGPPHDPYQTAPAEFRALYDPQTLKLRPNVPPAEEVEWREKLAGYYAHCTALDSCVGELLQTLEDANLSDDTIFIFTSDHGDMLGSQGEEKKQRPWSESTRVPCLLRYPARFGREARTCDALVNSLDWMPTLLGLCGAPIPETVEGRDFSTAIAGGADPSHGAALLACFHPFGEYSHSKQAHAYRGVRTQTHTYVRSLEGPWLLYDDGADPYQMTNLIDLPGHEKIQAELETQLQFKLREQNDEFLDGWSYIKKWNYEVDKTGTAPYQN